MYITHSYVLQVLMDGWNPNIVDMDGNPLLTLIYLSREKKPQYTHNLAGARKAVVIKF